MHKLWRVRIAVVITCIVLGAGYGWASARANVNPFYEPGALTPAFPGQAWGWRPSPWWLPSYLLCVVPRNGYGIEHTRSGYLFRNDAARVRYTSASVALGAGLGLGAAAASLALRRVCGRQGGA